MPHTELEQPGTAVPSLEIIWAEVNKVPRAGCAGEASLPAGRVTGAATPFTCGAALPGAQRIVLQASLQAELEDHTAMCTCAHKYICTHSHFPAP